MKKTQHFCSWFRQNGLYREARTNSWIVIHVTRIGALQARGESASKTMQLGVDKGVRKSTAASDHYLLDQRVGATAHMGYEVLELAKVIVPQKISTETKIGK